ncbi:MAG: AsmA family protein, partial [Verrucomicrobiales bacterium]
MHRIFSILLKGLALVVGVVILVVAVFLAFDIKIDLSRFREDIDRQLSEALGREISIDGEVVLVAGTTPTLRVGKVTVENPPDWEGGGRLAYLRYFETSIGLAELLDLEIDIDDITVNGLELNLEEDGEGRRNWDGLTGSSDAESQPKPEETEDDEPGGLDLDFTGLDFITVTDLSVTHKIDGEPVIPLFGLEHLSGSALAGQPVQLVVTGHLRSLPFEGTFTGGTLEALLSGATAWPIDFQADLRGATLALKGNVSAADLRFPGGLEMALDIPKIQRLEPVTGPLPLRGPLRLEAMALSDASNRLRLTDLRGTIAGADLSGTVELDLRADLPTLGGEITVGVFDLALGEAGEDESDDAAPVAAQDPPPGAASEAPDSEAPEEAAPSSILPFAGAFTIKIEEITGLPTSLRDLAFDLDITRETASAEVTVDFADAPFSGRLELHRESGSETIAIELALEAKDADLTELVRFYTADDRITGHFETAHFRVSGNGPSLMDSWDRRSVDLEIENAGMSYESGEETWDFLLANSKLHRDFGEPGSITGTGTAGNADFEVEVSFFLPEGARMGVVDGISGKIADLEFTLRDATRAGADSPFEVLEFDLKGGRLDHLDTIYELDLPPLGPYAARGTLRHSGGAYELDGLELEVGESRMLADVHYEPDAKPRKITATLNAETIQL